MAKVKQLTIQPFGQLALTSSFGLRRVNSAYNWVSLWIGFHFLVLYIHNDTIAAFGEQDKQLLIEPVFGQVLQGSSGKAFYSLGVNEIFDSFLIPLGPGDLLAHHAISLALHVTSLIVLKGSLDGCGSKLMPDKLHLGFGYACDGPGRGGTCDLSAWDTSIQLSSGCLIPVLG